MNLISVKDLNFIEQISSADTNIKGGIGLDLAIPFVPSIALSALSNLDFVNGNTTNSGNASKESQAIASFSSDKRGSTETYTYSA